MHRIGMQLGIELDQAVEEFGLENVLDMLQENKCNPNYEVLSRVPVFDLAKYLIQGYSYPKTPEQTLHHLVEWVDTYDQHTPPRTKNSSYRKGRREVLIELKTKMAECGIFDQRTGEIKI